MAKSELLKHIQNREVKRVARYLPASVLESETKVDGVYGTRHRLSLKSQVEYDVFDSYAGPLHPAHEHARARLIDHIYGEQQRIAHDLLSALYGSASHEELIPLIDELLRSMRE